MQLRCFGYNTIKPKIPSAQVQKNFRIYFYFSTLSVYNTTSLANLHRRVWCVNLNPCYPFVFMKVFFRRIHLYLGLAAGLIIMNSCLTGMVLAFQEELEHLFYAERYYIEPAQTKLPIQQMIASLHQQVPEAHVFTVKLYTDPTRSTELNFRKEKPKEASATGTQAGKEARKGKEGNRRAFVNPYTGQVIDIYSPHDSFFHSIEDFHRRLVGGSVGKTIVGISTLFFLFILITGLVLWYPPTKVILKQRLTLKKTSNWKRLAYDFHLVLGFYTSIFLFIIAFTGLTLAFDWFSKSVAVVTQAGKPIPPPTITYQPNQPLVSYDQIAANVTQHVPESDFYSIAEPKDSASAFAVNVHQKGSLNAVATDTYFFHPYTAQIAGFQFFSDKNIGQTAKSLFKPIHMGTVFGIYSKVLVFIVALIGFLMPLTGTLIWWNRTRKKNTSRVTSRIFRAS